MSKAAIQIPKITKMNCVFMLLFVFIALILNPDTVQAGYTGPQRTPAATVSITLSCAYQNGWCRNGGNAVITGYDPLYAIVAIEGSNSGNGFSCSSASCTVPLHEGANQILAWAVSSFGDTSEMGALSVGVDSVSPKINLTVPSPTGENRWYIKPLPIRVAGTDIGSGVARAQISLGGSVWENNALQINQDGRFQIIGLVSDYAGNATRESMWVKVDVTAPDAELHLSQPDGENGWYVQPAFVSISGSDGFSGAKEAKILVDGEPILQRDAKALPTLEEWKNKSTLRSRYTTGDILNAVALVRDDGIHQITGVVTDEAGNFTEKTTIVNIDAQPPVINFVLPDNFKNVITFTGSVKDPLSGIREMRIDYGAGMMPVFLSSSAWQVDVDTKELKLEDGEHTLHMQAVDLAGNIATIQKRFTVFNHTWPFITIIVLTLGLMIGFWADPRCTAWQNLAASVLRLKAVSFQAGGDDD